MNHAVARFSIMAPSMFMVASLAGVPIAHGGDVCEAAIRRVESSSPHSLDCRELRRLDDMLRRCPVASTTPAEGLEVASWEVDVALRRCACTSRPDADQLVRRVATVPSAFELVTAESLLAQAERCVREDAADERRKLATIRARIEQATRNKEYCAGTSVDWNRLSKAQATTCYEARLQRAAFGRARACSAVRPDDDAIVKALNAKEAQVCRPTRPAPSCDTALAIAGRLRQSSTPADLRRLWNLVATQLLAASGSQATRDDRECATRMIATAVPDHAVSDAVDRVLLDSITSDPELRDRFVVALKGALKDSADAEELVTLLNNGADVKEVIRQASLLAVDKQRRFFRLAGGIGRILADAWALTAYEQSERAFDLVIAPAPRSCKYSDFVHVVLAAFTRAEPAPVAIEVERVTAKAEELAAARMRSCGKLAPAANAGPGCGAVISVQLEERGPNRAAGVAKLLFVTSNDKGDAVKHEPRSIELPEFQSGCSATSEEVQAARKLVHRMQFEFMRMASDVINVVDKPIPTEFCGLRPIAPRDWPTGRHDGKGIRITGPELEDEQSGDPAVLEESARGAREALQAWKYTAGEIDAESATASLRFSSQPYTDDAGNQGRKVEADLKLNKQRAASFATVVLTNDPSCRASLVQQYIQAGRIIGYEAGSFLAYRASEPRPPPPRRRWLLAAGLAIEASLVAGGIWTMSSAVSEQNYAAAHGFDTSGPNDRLWLGRALLGTAVAGAIAGAIYAIK
jgi:hypothetical protein